MSEPIDLFLRAPSAEAFHAAAVALFPEAVVVDGQGAERLRASSHQHILDAGFAVVATPAVVDAAGVETTPAILAQGYHANLRLLGPLAEQRAAAIRAGFPAWVLDPPAAPARVFAD